MSIDAAPVSLHSWPSATHPVIAYAEWRVSYTSVCGRRIGNGRKHLHPAETGTSLTPPIPRRSIARTPPPGLLATDEAAPVATREGRMTDVANLVGLSRPIDPRSTRRTCRPGSTSSTTCRLSAPGPRRPPLDEWTFRISGPPDQPVS
jgi:hypothetical protein